LFTQEQKVIGTKLIHAPLTQSHIWFTRYPTPYQHQVAENQNTHHTGFGCSTFHQQECQRYIKSSRRVIHKGWLRMCSWAIRMVIGRPRIAYGYSYSE